MIRSTMQIKTDTTHIDVTPGIYVFDKQTDTYIEWDDLAPTMIRNIEALTAEIQKASDKLRDAITRADIRTAA